MIGWKRVRAVEEERKREKGGKKTRASWVDTWPNTSLLESEHISQMLYEVGTKGSLFSDPLITSSNKMKGAGCAVS